MNYLFYFIFVTSFPNKICNQFKTGNQLMIRLPFFFLITFLWCILFNTSCTRNYYHNESPFGYLKGNVKKVTDTVYNCAPDGSLHVLQEVDYYFDAVNRLTEEYVNTFSIHDANGEKECDTNLVSFRNTINRYDRNGRRVETKIKSCVYQDTFVIVN